MILSDSSNYLPADVA